MARHVKKKKRLARTPSRHSLKHGRTASNPIAAIMHGAHLLGREYVVTSHSPLTTNEYNGIVGHYVVGTRPDGRTRTVFIPHGPPSGA